LHFWCVNTDFDYNKTVEIKMTDGRFLDKSFASDSACYVINDIAARVMKYEKPIGQTITIEGKKGTIIGVFKDFHAIDLKGPYAPTIIRIKTDDRPTLLVKYSSGSYPDIAAKISTVFKHYDPESQFQAMTVRDTEFSELAVPSNLVGLAFFIALMLACLGLFGLASFTTESRTKEIGIRKVNGASNKTVIGMLLTNYIKWLTIAFIIALPIAFMVGKFFLGMFNFHTSMPYWAFIAGPAIAYIIALSTVSSQSWRAAAKNPVKALRYE